nr:uncharacterized protein LOC121124488 [Lepeophtheirus salmonis]
MVTFFVRGIPPHRLYFIDYKYYLQVIDGEMRFSGVSKTLIKRISENSTIWILTYAYDFHKTIAIYNGTKSYPWGLNTWFFQEGRTYEQIPLKITKCGENQFSCNELKCIPLSSVCNDLKDCADAEDEKECTTIETLAYRKDFPPHTLENKKGTIPVHIQFHLISINKIDEPSGELEIRYFIQLHWKDPRIKFYHLFNDTERILTNEEKNYIWIPPLLFDNAAKSQYKFIEDHHITISARKEKYTIGSPNSVSFLSEKLNFNGMDVYLIYRTENNLKFFCTFNYLNYPFDTQNCKIFIGLPLDIKRKVELIVNTSTRFEPIHLLEYELSGLMFESTDNGVTVFHITLKRLFYNIFWITYLPTLFCRLSLFSPFPFHQIGLILSP